MVDFTRGYEIYHNKIMLTKQKSVVAPLISRISNIKKYHVYFDIVYTYNYNDF